MGNGRCWWDLLCAAGSSSAHASAERLVFSDYLSSAAAQRPRERGASWSAVTSFSAAPLSQAGRQSGASEHSTPCESAAAPAGRRAGCGQRARCTPRKRCRRCRLAPCISVTAVHDAVALARALGFVVLAHRVRFRGGFTGSKRCFEPSLNPEPTNGCRRAWLTAGWILTPLGSAPLWVQDHRIMPFI